MKLSRLIVWTLAAGLFCFAVSGCTTQEQFLASASTLEVGGYIGDSNEDRSDKRSWDGDQEGLFASFQPFAWWGMKMQAEMSARAILDQKYAERCPPPPEEPKLIPPPPCEEPKPVPPPCEGKPKPPCAEKPKPKPSCEGKPK